MSPVRTSLMFSFAEKYALLLINVSSSMVLARLLVPAETGVYAVGAVLLGIAQVLRDFGAGQYLVQLPELSKAELRTVLGASLLSAWPLGVMVLAGADLMANFYADARLAMVLRLLALNFFVVPFSSIIIAVLRRQLRFGLVCFINLSYALSNAALAIGLAWQGFSYLSLALAAVGASSIAVGVALWCRPPEFSCLPSLRGARQVFKFGGWATSATFIDEIGVAAPELVIGKFAGMSEVGLFGKAQAVLAVFNQAITGAVAQVVFPLFAAQARAQRSTAQAYLLTVTYMTALSWPFFGFVALMAEPLVSLLYGQAWLAAAPLVQIMSVSAALYSVFSMARYLFVACGQVQVQARIDALSVAGRIALLLAAAPFGLTVLAWAVVAGLVWRSALTFHYLRALSTLDCKQLVLACRANAGLALATASGPLLAHIVGLGGVAALLVAGASSALCWLAGLFWLGHPLRRELRWGS